VLHKTRSSLVYVIVDDRGPVIGKLRAANLVEERALALLQAFGDLAVDRLEFPRA
jgi:hypothetical protein